MDRTCEHGNPSLRTSKVIETINYDMGILFTLSDQCCVASVHEIQEVILLPKSATSITDFSNTRTLTTIPGTHNGLLGMTNLRGRLLPLIDLALICGLPENKKPSRQSVLVVDFDNTFCGLIVDSVQYFRQFDRRYYKNDIPKSLNKGLHCCIVGSYDDVGGNDCKHDEYLVFSFQALLHSHQFLNLSPVVMTP